MRTNNVIIMDVNLRLLNVIIKFPTLFNHVIKSILLVDNTKL